MLRVNVRTLDAQIDLLVRNMNTTNPVLREFGTYMLVECKDWNRPVSAPLVKSFIANLRSASCHSGILVSLRKVSGERANKNASYSIRKYYHSDNIEVIVIGDSDLYEVAKAMRYEGGVVG